MSKIYFAHRPPSVGIHLLSDPFPTRTVSPAALQATNQNLSLVKKQGRHNKAKKSAPHS